MPHPRYMKVDKAPDRRGSHGKAWKCDIEEGLRLNNIDPAESGCLVQWLLEVPNAHPVWHSYVLALVHLRPLKNGGTTILYLSNATHELWLYALNPNCNRNEIVATGSTERMLLDPMNFAAQIVEVSDELALKRIEEAVQLVCDGKLNPDTDYIQQWAALFGSNMLKR